jgi:hypothetical protein
MFAGVAAALSLVFPCTAQEPVKIISVAAVNTPADETDPFVAATNRALLYATNAAGTFDIYVAHRPGTAWTKGAPLPGYDDRGADERSPYLHNTTVYFASNFVPDDKLKDLKNYDLKFSTEGRAPLPLLGISTKDDELHPWVHQGKEFYFSRKTPDGWKQFVAAGPTPGPIGKAKELDFAVGFHNASLSPDGRSMYLEGPIDEKRTRLFVSTRTQAGWTQPKLTVNLSMPDDAHSDAGPAISPDGRYLYFASDRAGGQGGWDIYAVAVSSLKTRD